MGVPDAVPLRVIAAVIVRRGSVLLVSKRAAPDVFYLPGGKPDEGEEPLATLGRELREELGVTLVDSTPLTVVFDRAALEPVAMEMHVYLAEVTGPVEARAEIAALAWVGAAGQSPGVLAPAVERQVLPLLAERGLIG